MKLDDKDIGEPTNLRGYKYLKYGAPDRLGKHNDSQEPTEDFINKRKSHPIGNTGWGVIVAEFD